MVVDQKKNSMPKGKKKKGKRFTNQRRERRAPKNNVRKPTIVYQGHQSQGWRRGKPVGVGSHPNAK